LSIWEKKIINIYIISNYTSRNQRLSPAIDVSIHRPLKVAIKAKLDNWYQSYGVSEVNKTNAGYLRPPSYDSLINWTLEASREINPDVITRP